MSKSILAPAPAAKEEPQPMQCVSASEITIATLEARVAELEADARKAYSFRIRFDGPPGPEGGRFVECETLDGKGVNVGHWEQEGDNWLLFVEGYNAPDGCTPAERKVLEAGSDRSRILRWLRVALQWNSNARSFADAIERGDYDAPYTHPGGEIDGRTAMTGEEYDAELARRAEVKTTPGDASPWPEWKGRGECPVCGCVSGRGGACHMSSCVLRTWELETRPDYLDAETGLPK
jgi:hypothetical protein